MKHKLYTRLLSLALAVGLVIGMLPSAAAVDTVGGSAGQAVTLDDSTIQTPDGLEISKTIINDEDGYKVQLEAYTTGNITSTGGESVPADIVLVLDMSGSMDYCLNCGESEDDCNCRETYEATYDIKTDGTYYIYSNRSYSRVYYCDTCKGWYTTSRHNRHENSTKRTPKTSSSSGGTQFYKKTGGFVPRIDALKEAVNGFIDSVAKDATENKVDHKISIVKFAGQESTKTGNDTYTEDRNTYNYSQIVKGLTNASSGQTELKNAVNSLQPNGSTRIDYGLKRANAVFTGSAPEGRNRIVVAFTDGEPSSFSDYDASVANGAISQANTLKNSKGATVYSVGVFSGANGQNPVNLPNTTSSTNRANRFMHLISSNYPSATNMSTPGSINSSIDTTDPNDTYYLAASDKETLDNIFQQISDEVQGGGSSFKLDENAVIKDVMSDTFQLPANVNENDVTVEYYKAQYSGSDLSWSKDFSYNPQITKQITTDSKGEDVVNVSGFDFDHNFVSEKGRVEGDVTQSGNFYGRKIVITFPIEVKDGFFGGNNVPTNDITSGIYRNNTETTPVGQFEIPNLNVPVNCNATGSDQSIYITQSADVAEMVNLSAEPNGWNNAYVTITYKVTDSEGKEIGAYTIQPGATTGTWSGDSVSPKDCKNYTVTCTITPNEGTSDSVGNAVVTGKETHVQAVVHVFTPTVTWTDSSKEYGTSLDDTLLDSHEVTVTWEDKNTPHSVADPSGSAPTLDYTYVTPTNEALPGTLTEETHVKVSAVKIGDTNILANTKFEWQKDSSCPNTCADPNDAYQFRIHMGTSHENEYPVRFYLEGVGSGVRDYPYSDAWAKLNSWLSGGFANVTTSENPMTEFKSLQGETGYDASVSGGSTAGGIAGHANVLTWLEKYNVSPAIDVNDISAVLTELVKMYPEIANASVTSVGGEEYTVNEIIENLDDFQIVYTQVTQNHDQLIEYYKGNGSLAAGQDSYHVHLSIRKNPGDLTITKTFSGVENLPNTFAIEVRDSAGQLIDTLSLNEATESNGTYTWTLENLNEDIYTVTETGMNVEDMSLSATMKVTDEDTTTPETVKETTAKVKVADNKTSTVEIANSYSAADGKLNINKVVTEFANNGKPVFDFKLTAQDGTVYYYHVDMTGTAVNTEKAATPDGGVTLPVGEYTIEELSNQNYTLESVEVGESSIENGGTITVTSQGTTTVTFTNDAKNTNIPTDGSATENKVLDIKDGVIAWKPTPVQYGNDPNHDNINPDDDPAE